ncbi:MAG: 5'-methylthioadenosine phosphorylase [Pseudomonadota bacterium]
MHKTFFAAAFTFSATAALADSFIMGPGRWTCQQVVAAAEGTDNVQKGQVVGWVLGYWSRSTEGRGDAFVDTVEKVGGRKIFEITVDRCRNSDPETPLFRVARSMVKNTK